MKSETISVIVPVYQAEKTLEKCIESILNQTYSNIQLILVDDGSKDQSWNIIEKYQKRDARIIVYRQSNLGVSVARNRGMQLATGKYILFVDADDYIEQEYCAVMQNQIKTDSCDVVICDINEKIIDNKAEKFDRNKLAREFVKLYRKWVLHNVCGKLYQKKQIEDCIFPVGVRLGEDLIFNLQVFSKINTFTLIPYYGYTYVENKDSATKIFEAEDFETQKMLLTYSMDFYEKLTGNKKCIYCIEQVFLWNVIDIYTNMLMTKSVSFWKEYLKEKIQDNILRDACIRSQPQTLQRRILKQCVLHRWVNGLIFIGFIKRCKYKVINK